MYRFASAMRLMMAVAVVATLPASSRAQAEDDPTTGRRTQNFSSDPKWDGHRNRLVPTPAPLTRQDFGYHPNTRRAGGEMAGELGGWIERSTRRAAYAKPIADKTLNDKLAASGTFAVTHDEGSSGTMFGWFNDADSLGRQLGAEPAAPQVQQVVARLERLRIAAQLRQAGTRPLLVPARQAQPLLVVDRANPVAALRAPRDDGPAVQDEAPVLAAVG
ncbi:MAG: hypothetical protein H0W53_22500 [Acidobacteria bacterium]|nr:hypothetical protein [Acidobacteriota bacterium]